MTIIEDIKKLKKDKNAVILAHCYQNIEIDEVADYVGDSLYLSRMASKTDADIIVFSGVYFMAETAKILSPNKKVLLPNKNAGCFMADMITEEQIKEFKKQNPNKPVVCYVNSSARVKAEADICCTSANAVDVVKNMKEDELLFVPDIHLGSYVQEKLKNKKITCYPGFCPTHVSILPKYIEDARKNYPNARILAHPECHKEVLKMVDFVGSTSAIINYVKNSSDNEFVIATEMGVVDRLKRDYPNKKIYAIHENTVCKNMKVIELVDIYNCLKNEEYEVTVDKEIADRAYSAIKKMVEIGA